MKSKFPDFFDILGIFGFYFLFSLVAGIFLVLFPKKLMALSIFLSYVISMGLTVWATKRAFNRKSKFNFTPQYLALLPLVVIGAYAFLIVGEMTVQLIPEPQGLLKKWFDSMNQPFEALMKSNILGFLTIAVAAPLLEEMLFRGIILKGLLKKTTPWKAILLTAVIFGVFHANPWQFLYATIVGVLLGYMYWKTRSLFYPILIHFILNGTAFLSAVFLEMNPNEGISDMLEEKQSFYIMVFLSLLIILLLYKFFENYFKNQKSPLILATQNKHKIEEIKKILPSNIEISFLSDINFQGNLKETGTTLQANAVQKMRQISYRYDVDVLADDTGLEVEALNGEPGVYSARYSGENASYEENVNKLLSEMEGIENRKARFRTVIALSFGAEEKLFQGIINGTIAVEPIGTNGFGYDSVFIPEGETRTFAQMTNEEKNLISHRANALKKLKDYFKKPIK